jgi:hypothetical protein
MSKMFGVFIQQWTSNTFLELLDKFEMNLMNIGSTLSQPHFGLSVRVKPTLPKVGTWSPPGLPKT